MKLTGILKNKVDKAETMAEKKDLIAEAGMELNDIELEMVTGGIDVAPPEVKGPCRKCDGIIQKCADFQYKNYITYRCSDCGDIWIYTSSGFRKIPHEGLYD